MFERSFIDSGNSQIIGRTVRTELVEVQSLVRADGAGCSATGKTARFVSYFAALPFDRLRANGSFGKSVKHNVAKLLWAFAFLVFTSASHAGTLSIESAETWDNTLYLRLNFAPNADVLEALDASVPLKFVLSQRTSGSIWQNPYQQVLPEQSITLSYAALLERFELIANGTVKPYRLRAELLDAFNNLQLTTTPKDARPGAMEVRLSLSIGALPAPLRLPALLDSDWWLDSGWVAVRVGTDAVTSASKQ